MTSLSRRRFLGAIGLPAAAAAVAVLADPTSAARALAAANKLPAAALPPGAVAGDEDFWAEVGRAFTVDRSLVNLNNAGVSPAPGFVQDAMKRHLDYSNDAPAYTMWRVLEPQREAVRARMARAFGCDTEEVALTRNASESLQTCQFGFDLAAGDEVLTTNQDYPRMITTFQQRVRREGIVLNQFSIPTPAEDDDEIVDLFERNITPRTKLILMCHMINITGQILPVRKVVAMARRKGIPVIVDGAHALAHFDFTLPDLDCDYYASSLHKWLFAPHGTGLLYVRKDKIGDLWPLMDRRPLAAHGGERGPGRRHPQVRGDRHAPGGQHAGHRRGPELPPGAGRRAQGGATRVPARVLGREAVAPRSRAPAHQPQARLRLRHRQRRDRGHRARRAEQPPLVEAPHPHHT
ncbi:MAG: aminotransferase class V-fold PLP-dependent enzyme, partial [Planctomycetota bacterium]